VSGVEPVVSMLTSRLRLRFLVVSTRNSAERPCSCAIISAKIEMLQQRRLARRKFRSSPVENEGHVQFLGQKATSPSSHGAKLVRKPRTRRHWSKVTPFEVRCDSHRIGATCSPFHRKKDGPGAPAAHLLVNKGDSRGLIELGSGERDAEGPGLTPHDLGQHFPW
jgi:hypothetical protein